MLYGQELIGAFNQPIYAAARWLLANGVADPADTVETYRGEMLCLSGNVGKLAKLTVVEDDDGDPSPGPEDREAAE